jgi:hypothetical protein
MSPAWPDELTKADAEYVTPLLPLFWARLSALGDLLARDEQLLCAELLAEVRKIVLAMMLALNGIVRPAGTQHLNVYLGESQRQAMEKTLTLPASERDGWIGQAVALVVIYRWYAPQLVDAYDVPYPGDEEGEALRVLSDALPEWPRTISTS